MLTSRAEFGGATASFAVSGPDPGPVCYSGRHSLRLATESGRDDVHAHSTESSGALLKHTDGASAHNALF